MESAGGAESAEGRVSRPRGANARPSARYLGLTPDGRYVRRDDGTVVRSNTKEGKALIKARQEAHRQKSREATLVAPGHIANAERQRAMKEARLAREAEERAAKEAAEAAAKAEAARLAEEERIKNASDAELLAMIRERARTDLFFFATEVCELGYNPNPKGPRITEDQRELCEWLQREQEKFFRFVLTPRDTLKSTVLQAYVLWTLFNNPNARVLLYGEVHEQAKKRLAAIKRIITTSQMFKLVCGEWYDPKLPWNEEMIVIAARTQHAIREASVETGGLDVVLNARHFDLLIPDDLHSEKNTTTKEAIEGVKEKIQLLLPLADKESKVVMAGVFWTDNDAHCWLIEENRDDVEVFRRSIWKNDDPEQGVAYPHQLPIEAITRRKRMMRKDLFACHYLLDPIPKEDAAFQAEYFTTLQRSALPADLRVYVCVDQAGDPTSETENRRDSDFTAIVAVGVTPAQDLILLDAFRGRVNPTEAVEHALVFILRHKPLVVGVERAGIGNMAFYLRKALNERGLYALVDDVMPQGRSKYERVMALEPIARRRKFFLLEGAQGVKEWLDEITRFPKAKHDDLVDATAYVLDLMKKYGDGMAEVDEDQSLLASLARLNEDSKAYWFDHHKKERKNPTEWVQEFAQ